CRVQDPGPAEPAQPRAARLAGPHDPRWGPRAHRPFVSGTPPRPPRRRDRRAVSGGLSARQWPLLVHHASAQETAMPRIRTLKPEALQHRKVGRLSDAAFRLWVGLVTQADDEGRLAFDAHQFRVLVWGYHLDRTSHDVDNALEEISKLGLCRIYAVGDSLYVDLPSWRDHQKIDRPRPSILPKYSTKDQDSPKARRFFDEPSASTRRGPEGSEGAEGSKLHRAN